MTDALTDLQKLSTLLLGLDRTRLNAMAELLRRAGLPLSLHTDPSAALDALERLHPQVLLVDAQGKPPEAVLPHARLSAARRRPRLTLVLDPPRTPEVARWLEALSSASVHPVYMGSPYSILEAVLPHLTQLGSAPEAAAPAPRAPAPALTPPPEAGPVDVEGVCFVASLWGRRHTGSLLTRRGVATLVRGLPVDIESRRLMAEAMREGGATFQAADESPRHQTLGFGPQLWEGILGLAEPAVVLERADHILVERGMAPRVRELPIPADLRRLLANLQPSLSVRALCVSTGSNLEQVAAPLSALVRSGFYQLRPAPPGPVPTPVSPPPPAPPTRVPTNTTLSGTELTDPRFLERLRREWERVENADDWTALGVPADSPIELVNRALQRLESRYLQLQEQAPDPQVQALGAQLLERARAAAERARAGRPKLAPRGSEQHQAAFEQGRKALEREDWALAVRWFHAARELLPHSALYTGYLGWALYHSPQHDMERRRAKGRELLELADATGDPIPELQCYLVIVEADAGELEGALQRAERAVRNFPEHAPARVLAERLRRDLCGRPGR